MRINQLNQFHELTRNNWLLLPEAPLTMLLADESKRPVLECWTFSTRFVQLLLIYERRAQLQVVCSCLLELAVSLVGIGQQRQRDIDRGWTEVYVQCGHLAALVSGQLAALTFTCLCRSNWGVVVSLSIILSS